MTWRASAATVVDVDEFGLVTAIAVGTAAVEAISKADTTKRASAIIRVVAAPTELRP